MFEEKPQNLSIKNFLITTIAKSEQRSREDVEMIISHQFKNLHAVMDVYQTVEVCGLGRFLFNHKAAKKSFDRLDTIAKQYEGELNDKQKALIEVRNEIEKKL